MPEAEAKAGATDVHLISEICWYCYLLIHKRKRENEREKEKGRTMATVTVISSLKVPHSAEAVPTEHAQQGKNKPL